MNTNPNDNAFSRAGFLSDHSGKNSNAPTNGLTKREYFAGLAMQGMLANHVEYNSNGHIAELAVEAADALIESLNKSNP